jgi:uncharacterized membrane protein
VLLGLGVVRWRLVHQTELLTSANTSVALAGTLFSGYLTYLELFVIHAICQWCVASAVIVTLLLLVEGWGLRQLLRGETSELVSAPAPPRQRRQQPSP